MTVTLKLVGEITSLGEIAISRPGRTGMAPKKPMNGSEHYFVPGASFKGKLRATMTAMVCDHLEQNGLDRMSYIQVARNAVGGVKGDSKGTPSPLDVLALQEANPIIAAFGSGDPVFSTGRIIVGDMVSLQPVSVRHVISGVRADPFRRDPELVQKLDNPEDYANIQKINAELKPLKDTLDILNGGTKGKKKKVDQSTKDAAIAKLIATLGRDITEEQIRFELETLVKLRVALGGSTNPLLMPLPDIEVIPQGQFTQTIRARNTTPASVGMLIKALERISCDLRIGGLSGRGLGYFDVTYTVFEFEDGEWVEVGKIVIENDTFHLSAPNDGTLARCVQEYETKMEAGEFDFRFSNFKTVASEEATDEA